MNKLRNSVTDIFQEEYEWLIMLMDVIYPVNEGDDYKD